MLCFYSVFLSVVYGCEGLLCVLFLCTLLGNEVDACYRCGQTTAEDEERGTHATSRRKGGVLGINDVVFKGISRAGSGLETFPFSD